MKKKHGFLVKLALVSALVLAMLVSCDVAGLSGTQYASEEPAEARGLVKPEPQLDAAGNLLPQKIVGTAGIGADAFFFEFDVSGKVKFARAFVPVSKSGFLVNGKILYRKENYRLTTLNIIPSPDNSGATLIMGTTATVAGTSYSFQGVYSKETGFFGNIQKTVNGIVLGSEYDFFGGTPIFPRSDVENYIGYATFHFDSDTTALIFNAAIDNKTKNIVGTWCETKPGLGNIHGTILGVRTGKTVSFNGEVLDMYKSIPGLYLDTMTADGAGTFTNPSEKTITGSFIIHWVGYDWPSDFIAVKVQE